MSDSRAEILIVDDNARDAELMTVALHKHLPDVSVSLARDGSEAIQLLTERPAAEAPRLILLDLKMPKVDGFEVLRWLKGHSATRSIPVVVLTSSDLDRDIQLAYSLGANSYVVKPMEFDDLSATLGRLGAYWLCIDRGLPPEGP